MATRGSKEIQKKKINPNIKPTTHFENSFQINLKRVTSHNTVFKAKTVHLLN